MSYMPKKRKPVYAPGIHEQMQRAAAQKRVETIASVPEICEADFTSRVLNSEKPILVIFSADWCEPCQRFLGKPDPNHHNGGPDFIEGRPPHYGRDPMQPGYYLLQIIDPHKDHLDVVIVDWDRSSKLCKAFSVEYVPHMIICHRGKYYERPPSLFIFDRVNWVNKMMNHLNSTASPKRPRSEQKPSGRSIPFIS